MNSSSAITAPSSRGRLTPGLVLDAWRGITSQQVRTTFLLGCALHLVLIASGIALGGGIQGLPGTFVAQQIKAFAQLLTFVVADRVTACNPDRRGVYALAVIIGAAIAAPIAVVAVQTIWTLQDNPVMRDVPRGFSLGLPMLAFMDTLIFAGATVMVILDRRRVAQARERLHAAELDRIAAERRSVESDLQALQARVEPKFLFNTLAQVQELYDQDCVRGERMLDDLIAYLRAAMPRIRETSSTVGQELELARAYLEIVKVRLGERIEYAIKTQPELADARFPPMMLLPLIDHAVLRADDQSPIRALHIAMLHDGDAQLRVTIRDNGAAFAPEAADEGVGSLRERLAALYGEKASLALEHCEREATAAVISLPLEPATS